MKVCAHCGKRFRVGGSLHTGGVEYPLCHPDEGLDCHHLVTVYGEEIGSRKVDHKKLAVIPVGPDHVQELLTLLEDNEPETLELTHREVEQLKKMMED